jgi:hypothetical protein
VEGSRALGIDFEQTNKKVEHPSSDKAQAVNRSGAGAWVDAQIQVDLDELTEPPAALREFLQDRREAVWGVITSLEKGEPDWGPDTYSDGNLAVPFLPIIRLERVLVAAALVEEYDGNRIEAGRALEAAWSLGRSISSRSAFIAQLLAMATERMQVGAVRKVQAPGLQWLGRLASDSPWARMLAAVSDDARFRPRGQDDGSLTASSEVAVKAFTAIAEALAKISPCDLAGMLDEEIWRPAAAALDGETNLLKRAFRDFYAVHGIENVANALRRAARLEVDREMTLKVLQLRLEKDASREEHWPQSLVDPTSAACPAAAYVYDSTAGGVELRFEGPIDVPTMGPVLPLKFRAKALQPSPTPMPPPPPLTPAPEGGMIAPQ